MHPPSLNTNDPAPREKVKKKKLKTPTQNPPHLATETIQSAALPFEGIHHIERRDRLALGMLSVRDSIPNDVFEELLEDTPSVIVDH
jgi:hypothetical protein